MNAHVRERATETALIRLASILSHSQFHNDYGASSIWVPADLRHTIEELAAEALRDIARAAELSEAVAS